MAKVLPKKEARGRKAAESAEKEFGQDFEPVKVPIDIEREINTKRSIFYLRKKTQEYKRKKEKKGSVTEEDMYKKVIV